MVLSLNTNISSINSARLLNITNNALARTTERLSSGLRINSSADDPAGIFMAESLTSAIRGAQAANLNIQMSMSAAQVADADLSNIYDVIQRMRELAVQANNSMNSAEEFVHLNAEFQALRSSLTQIASGSTFNGTALLDGTLTTISLQVGATAAATQTFTFSDMGYTADDLSLGAAVVITSKANAVTAIGNLDTALTDVADGRSRLGAVITSLEALQNANEVSVVSNSEARARVRDADVALEVSNLVANQIKQQAGAAALSAANFSTQFVLQLLQ
ncbi:MAG: flagellin FliC [Chloroflexi bacterium]|nr:flagellin FliC [Chloroflexota bacterium]